MGMYASKESSGYGRRRRHAWMVFLYGHQGSPRGRAADLDGLPGPRSGRRWFEQLLDAGEKIGGAGVRRNGQAAGG